MFSLYYLIIYSYFFLMCDIFNLINLLLYLFLLKWYTQSWYRLCHRSLIATHRLRIYTLSGCVLTRIELRIINIIINMDHLIVVLLISIDSFTDETVVIFLIFLLEVFIIFKFLWKDYVKEFLIEGFFLSLTLLYVQIWSVGFFLLKVVWTFILIYQRSLLSKINLLVWSCKSTIFIAFKNPREFRTSSLTLRQLELLFSIITSADWTVLWRLIRLFVFCLI